MRASLALPSLARPRPHTTPLARDTSLARALEPLSGHSARVAQYSDFYVCTPAFIVEMLVKITAMGFWTGPNGYLKNSWNWCESAFRRFFTTTGARPYDN